MKKIYFLLIIFIFLFAPNVYAQDFSVGSIITAPSCSGSNCSGGHYSGTEISETGTQNVYTINTRYNGTLSRIRFNIPLPSNWPEGDECFSIGDLNYKLTLNMATDDWRNKFVRPFISNSSSGTNWATSSMTFVSYKKVYFNFKIPSTQTTCVQFLYVDIQSPNTSSTAFTGISNWNLSSITLTVDFPSAPIVTPAPAPTGASNQDIINSQNNNTTNIINNQNSNTNSIINNQNDNTNNLIANNNTNTQDIIDSNSCPTGPLIMDDSFVDVTGSKLSSDGSLVSGSGITPYIKIKPNSTYNYTTTADSDNYACWYSRTNSIISCFVMASGGRTVTSPDNAFYLRLSFARRSGKFVSIKLTGPVCNDWKKEAIDKTNKAINDTNEKLDNINNSINNNNVDGGVGSDFFNDFSSQDNGGISGIISKPLVLINALLSNNNSCSALTFGIKFPNIANKNVSLPSGCILWNSVPNNVVNIYQIFVVGFCSYYLLKRLFKDVEDLKNPEKDNVEVIDL